MLGKGQGNHEGCPYMPPAPRLDSRSEAGMTMCLLAMTVVCGMLRRRGVVLVRMEADRLLSMTGPRHQIASLRSQ